MQPTKAAIAEMWSVAVARNQAMPRVVERRDEAAPQSRAAAGSIGGIGGVSNRWLHMAQMTRIA